MVNSGVGPQMFGLSIKDFHIEFSYLLCRTAMRLTEMLLGRTPLRTVSHENGSLSSPQLHQQKHFNFNYCISSLQGNCLISALSVVGQIADATADELNSNR